MEQPSDPVVQSLRDLGLDPAQVEAFLRGDAVV
jgi:hypothetical protein